MTVSGTQQPGTGCVFPPAPVLPSQPRFPFSSRSFLSQRGISTGFASITGKRYLIPCPGAREANTGGAPSAPRFPCSLQNLPSRGETSLLRRPARHLHPSTAQCSPVQLLGMACKAAFSAQEPGCNACVHICMCTCVHVCAYIHVCACLCTQHAHIHVHVHSKAARDPTTAPNPPIFCLRSCLLVPAQHPSTHLWALPSSQIGSGDSGAATA